MGTLESCIPPDAPSEEGLMTTAHDKIAQYLHEAHAMELALARTLQAHRAMTPTGPYRSTLDRHLRETRGHADAIARRLRELGRSPGLAERGYGIAQRLAGQLVVLGMAPLDLVRGASAEEKLLKNAKDECAGEALEIATYDALEALARQLDDAETAALAAALRADEERMLETLSEQLPALTAAVAGAELRGEPSYDAGRTGAAQALRARRRAAAETARNAADAARRATGDAAQGAADAVRAATGTSATRRREESRSPLPSYDELTVERVTARLDRLTPAQLRHVAAYERAHKRRRGVLEAIERHEQERERDHATA
jgi:ferritin-like metal-binding protein YciE